MTSAELPRNYARPSIPWSLSLQHPRRCVGFTTSSLRAIPSLVREPPLRLHPVLARAGSRFRLGCGIVASRQTGRAAWLCFLLLRPSKKLRPSNLRCNLLYPPTGRSPNSRQLRGSPSLVLALVPKRFPSRPGPPHSNLTCAQEAGTVHDYHAREEDRVARAKTHKIWIR